MFWSMRSVPSCVMARTGTVRPSNRHRSMAASCRAGSARPPRPGPSRRRRDLRRPDLGLGPGRHGSRRSPRPPLPAPPLPAYRRFPPQSPAPGPVAGSLVAPEDGNLQVAEGELVGGRGLVARGQVIERDGDGRAGRLEGASRDRHAVHGAGRVDPGAEDCSACPGSGKLNVQSSTVRPAESLTEMPMATWSPWRMPASRAWLAAGRPENAPAEAGIRPAERTAPAPDRDRGRALDHDQPEDELGPGLARGLQDDPLGAAPAA